MFHNVVEEERKKVIEEVAFEYLVPYKFALLRVDGYLNSVSYDGGQNYVFPSTGAIRTLYAAYKYLYERERSTHKVEFENLTRSVLIPEHVVIWSNGRNPYGLPDPEYNVRVYPKTAWNLIQEIVKIRTCEERFGCLGVKDHTGWETSFTIFFGWKE